MLYSKYSLSRISIVIAKFEFLILIMLVYASTRDKFIISFSLDNLLNFLRNNYFDIGREAAQLTPQEHDADRHVLEEDKVI